MAETAYAIHGGQPAVALTPTDQMLIERTEEALRYGGQLERWLRSRALSLFPLDLKKAFVQPYQAYGFFDTVEISGVTKSVMGCVQDTVFAHVTAPDAAERLKEFVLGYFLPLAHWQYGDGRRGGFAITQNLYRTVSGDHGKFPQEQATGCVDWRTLGSKYAWVLATILLDDFVMDFGPFHKKLDEAVCAVLHPDFVHIDERPNGDRVLDVSIGYPVIRHAPIPNVFGFGPGKFTIAVKLYSFLLSSSGDITVRMMFAAAPRCEKVFDFGPHWPDPIYGGAEVLSRLTKGSKRCQAFHDKLDAKMLAQHSRVHQALMDGAQKVWTAWFAPAAHAAVDAAQTQQAAQSFK